MLFAHQVHIVTVSLLQQVLLAHAKQAITVSQEAESLTSTLLDQVTTVLQVLAQTLNVH